MKKNYIHPVCETQELQSVQVICTSPEISVSPDPTDPNNVEIF